MKKTILSQTLSVWMCLPVEKLCIHTLVVFSYDKKTVPGPLSLQVGTRRGWLKSSRYWRWDWSPLCAMLSVYLTTLGLHVLSVSVGSQRNQTNKRCSGLFCYLLHILPHLAAFHSWGSKNPLWETPTETAERLPDQNKLGPQLICGD